jgi:hypothetical protein
MALEMMCSRQPKVAEYENIGNNVHEKFSGSKGLTL